MEKPIRLNGFLQEAPCATCTVSNPLNCTHRRHLDYSGNGSSSFFFDFDHGRIDEALNCTRLQVMEITPAGIVVRYPVCLRGIGLGTDK